MMNFFSKSLNIVLGQKATDVSGTDNARISIPDFFKVFITLLLIGASIWFFHIEEGLKLFELMTVVTPGFVIYAFLPLSYRMPFFFLLNCIALFLLFGIPIGSSILLICLAFIGITALPIAWKYRAALTVLATFVLIFVRVGFWTSGNSQQIVTVVGVLIMFRSILYLYELQYEKDDPGFWKRINYFFLLPNLIFYIFPIVDYKTFVRKYYDRPAYDNYSKGLKWMFRGITHFLLYRLMYYYLMPAMSDVHTVYDLFQYLLVSYALIVRLSGLFHFSAGVLCLFGFNLPETFNNYFLATSFSDLWRRINIYWKDFVMKVFYFPIYFKFKKRNNTAVFITVMIVFFFNWFLHAYQWFWIRGTFLLKQNDILFWALLGLVVAANSVYQKNTKAKKGAAGFHPREAFIKSAKIVGMLCLMSFLWSFWISPSIGVWWAFLMGVEPFGWTDVLVISAVALGCILLGTVLHYLSHQYGWQDKPKPGQQEEARLSYVNGGLLLLLLAGNPWVSQEIGDRFNFDMEPVLTTKLNKADEEQLFKGYYDELIIGNNLNSRMWEVDQQKPANWGNLKSTGIVKPMKDIILKELKPNEKVVFKNEELTTNSHGMRDQEYAIEKPAGSLRLALLGGSMEMGSAVADTETFESVLEQQLNQSDVFDPFQKIELLNFAIAGIHMPQHAPITERRVRPFQPDVLIYTGHLNELLRGTRKFGEVMSHPKWVADYPFLFDLANQLQLHPKIGKENLARALEPYKEDLYAWGLDRIAKVCREDDIVPIYIYILAPGDEPAGDERAQLKKMAEDKGFYFIDMYDVFEGTDPTEMATAVFDKHPNANGHRWIAQQLFKRLSEDEKLQQLILSSARKTSKTSRD